jgi:hypothetical protein
MKIRTRSSLLLGLVSAALGIAGCADYYAQYPGYGPYYGGAPYYAGYPGSVSVAVYDRPYYRGPGYWSGNVHYVWKPGHWVWRNGRKLWIRGHYVVRRY